MKKFLSFTFALSFSAVMLGVARATLVGVNVTPPVIFYVNTAASATRYDPISQIFAVDATPSTIQFTATDPVLTVLPPRSMSIRIQVDNTGALVGGVLGPDLVITGRVQRIVGGVTNIYSGELLTGDVTAFGSFDSGGTIDSYDFRFAPTGGLLLQFFQCDHIGVTLTSEGSTFTGSFTTNFNGHAKGNVGLEDLIAPTITCPYSDAGGVTNVQCSGSNGGQHGAFVTYPEPTGADNCDTNLTFVYTPPSGSFFALSASDISSNYTVTLTATDASGNQSVCSFTVTVEDTLAPLLDTGNPIIGECGEIPFVLTNDVGVCSATFTFTKPTAVDQCCTNGVHVTVSAIDQSSAVVLLTDNGDGTYTGHFPVTCGGSNVITSVAADGRGNTSQRQCAVYVVDIQPPSITCTDQVFECTGGPINFQEPIIFDNCPNVAISLSPTNGSVLNVGTNQIVATVTDCSGNTNQCTFNVTVQDTTPPTITCPTNITVQCGQATDPGATGTATANDTCDSNPTVTFTDATSGTCPVKLSRTWLATDHSGNTNQCVQIITITNAIPPTVTVPTGSFLGCNPTNLPTDVSVKYLVTAVDTCSTPIITVSHLDGTNGCTVTRTFTVTAADACNNPSAPQTVVYTWTADTTPPTVTVPTGSNLGCNPATLPTDASVKTLVTAVDSCSGVTLTVTHLDVPSGCGITRTFTVSAADACNNACTPKTVVYTWTVDTTPPTVTVPTGSNLGCNPTNLPTDVSLKTMVTVTDSCSTASITISHLDGGTACAMTRTFTITATDACNNVSSPQTVVYTWRADTTGPIITCPAAKTVSNLTLATTNYTGVATATDGCDAHPVVSYTDSTSNSCGSVITRTWRAIDSCGNTSTCAQVITIPGTASICGTVFADCDGNGALNGTEPGLSNAPVTLRTTNGIIVATTTTDGNGNYCFYNLGIGTYVVSNLPSAYVQTGGTCTNHWSDSYGRDCWNDFDGYSHFNVLGTNCWVAKDGYTHWKDKSTGYDTWKDSASKIHTQPCYTSCDTLKNGTVTVTLGPCQNKTGVNFAHAGSAPKIVCTVTAPATCKKGAVITYTCTVTNTGNACFSKGCNVYYSGGYVTCPNLAPGQSCTISKTYTCTQSVGVTFSCPITAYGYHPTGSCSASATCSTKVTN